jgi:hypothetical protein
MNSTEIEVALLEFPCFVKTGANTIMWKMASQEQKAKCVLWYCKSKFVVTGKRRYLRNFGGNYQRKFSVYKWCSLFSETGCILRGKVPVFVAKMNRVALGSCRRNSTRQTTRQLRSHEWRCTKILRIPLMSESYKNCCYV